MGRKALKFADTLFGGIPHTGFGLPPMNQFW